jgi:hypothetical protein
MEAIMIRRLIVIALLLCAGAARAEEMDAKLRQELLGLLETYNKAAAAGDLNKALALRSERARKDFAAETRTAAKRREMVEMVKGTTPESFKIEHARIEGDTATLHGVGSRRVPANMRNRRDIEQPPDGVFMSEMRYEFVREKGAWKLDAPVFGFDPRKVERCADIAFEGEEAFDMERSVSIGGRIVRAAFETDHTLLIVRLMDEENCLY